MHPSSFTQCPQMASWLRLPTYMTEVTKSERLCVAVESRRPKGKQSKVEPLPECSWELGSALSIGPSLPVGLPHPHCFFWLHFLLDKLLSPRSFLWGLFWGAQPSHPHPPSPLYLISLLSVEATGSLNSPFTLRDKSRWKSDFQIPHSIT